MRLLRLLFVAVNPIRDAPSRREDASRLQFKERA